MFFRWGENKRNEIRNTSAIRDGVAQDGQLPLWRANRALVGDWVHVFGAGTVFNLRSSYTYFLEWSYSTDGLGFDATQFWPSSLVQQLPSKQIGGIFPRIEFTNNGNNEFVNLSRGSAPNRNKIYTLQPNVSLNRGAHNIRSGLDVRWTNVFAENYNNSGGLVQFTPNFTRSTLNSTSVLEGNSYAAFLLGAPSSGQVDVNPVSHYQWFFAAPWIQDDWRVNGKLTVNLGFRWDFNGAVTEEENRLNYAFDPTIVNPVSSLVGQQVMGGIRFAGVDGAPTQPWKYDKNNYQFRTGMAYSINEKTVFRAGWGKSLPEPDESVVQRRVLRFKTRSSRRMTAGARRPTHWETPGPTGSRIPRGALSVRSPSWAATRASRIRTSSCRTSTSSRWASSASCRGISRST